MFTFSGRQKPGKGSRKRKIASCGLLLLLLATCVSLIVHENTKQTVTFYVNGEAVKVRTHAETVGGFLKEQGVGFSEHDYVFPSAAQPVTNGMDVEWINAKQYAITLGDRRITAWATSSRVRDILEKADVLLSEEDTVTPALHKKVDAGALIQVEKAGKAGADGKADQTYSASQ